MATAPRSMPPDAKRDVARWLENRQDEVDSAFQYLAMEDFDRMRGEAIACTEMILRLGRTSRGELRTYDLP